MAWENPLQMGKMCNTYVPKLLRSEALSQTISRVPDEIFERRLMIEPELARNEYAIEHGIDCTSGYRCAATGLIEWHECQNAAIMDTSPPNQQLIHDAYSTTQQHLLDHVESPSDGKILEVDGVVSNAIQGGMQL